MWNTYIIFTFLPFKFIAFGSGVFFHLESTYFSQRFNFYKFTKPIIVVLDLIIVFCNQNNSGIILHLIDEVNQSVFKRFFYRVNALFGQINKPTSS